MSEILAADPTTEPEVEEEALVLFMPSGRRGNFPVGTPVLDAARSLGVYIESVCGGRGICGRCQVVVAEGRFAKHGITSSADHLAAFTDTEARYRAKRVLADDRRLSCSAKVTGDIVEYHSACYCGDGHFHDWPSTLQNIRDWDLDAIAPGRGDALVGPELVNAALDSTADFVTSTYRSVARVALAGGSLKQAFAACRAACDEKFGDYAIYEHCLPFNVARAYDEARDIDTPRIWTAARDREMWESLQG